VRSSPTGASSQRRALTRAGVPGSSTSQSAVPVSVTSRGCGSAGRPVGSHGRPVEASTERYFARMQAERDRVDPPAWALQDYPKTMVVGPQIGM